MRWTMLIALVGLVACKGGGTVDDTESSDDTSVDDTNTDDTQAETGTVTVVVDFPVKPGIGPLIIGFASGNDVFGTLTSTESFAGPGFPEQQTHDLEIAPGDYYIGAWIDEDSDNPDRPGETDPKGVAFAGSPVVVTVEAGGTATPPVIKLRRPSTDPE